MCHDHDILFLRVQMQFLNGFLTGQHPLVLKGATVDIPAVLSAETFLQDLLRTFHFFLPETIDHLPVLQLHHQMHTVRITVCIEAKHHLLLLVAVDHLCSA